MIYSWHNIADKYNNNKLRYRETQSSDTSWKYITLPDGSYFYTDIDTYIKKITGSEDDENYPISLSFDLRRLPRIFTNDLH